eukprot:gene16511-5046_t
MTYKNSFTVAVLLTIVFSGTVHAEVYPATDARVGWMGRTYSDPSKGSVKYDWPCIAFYIKFTGTGIKLHMNGGMNNFHVYKLTST